LRFPGFDSGSRTSQGAAYAAKGWGFGAGYQGSSFSELLQVEFPHLAPDLGRHGGVENLSVPHGTTVLAFKYAEGVIVAGDRLATEGLRVASRDVQKVYATDDHSMIAIAGAAGPAIEMARIMRIELEHYEKIEGQALEIDGKANIVARLAAPVVAREVDLGDPDGLGAYFGYLTNDAQTGRENETQKCR
jgi:hypothetical protein